MSDVCNVCAETFNKSKRTIIKCYCGFECCKECSKTYLLSLKEDPCCMSCKMQWDRKFMYENFDNSFITKDYKKHREEILFERELGMLQATQPHVEKEIKIEKLSNNIRDLQEEYTKKLKELQSELTAIKESETVTKRKFIRKCPNNDCQGFLSTSLKCNLCECFTCSECREITGFSTEEKQQHVCNKEILESVKLLEKDSKPCPNCSCLIFKVMGCDQMYCVECHTAFSWRTLKIETGTIHNPHYYEYQRRMNNGIMPRNPLDVQCGRELDMNFINNLAQVFIQELPKGWKTKQKQIRQFNTTMTETVYINPKGKVSRNHPNGIHPMIEICRRVQHIRHVDQQRFLPNNRLNNNLQLRIDYMRKKIQKEEFQKIIQKREKENMKKTEISNVIGMFVMGMTDLFYRAYEERNQSIIYEMEQLRRYTNECLVNISNMYKCKNYIITQEYIFK